MPHTLGALRLWQQSASSPKAQLVHVHGIGEHSARHQNLFDELLKRQISVTRFDLRGMGESDGPRQWVQRFDEYLEDVDAVVDWAKKQTPDLPLFLMGHSLGGLIALHYTARYGPKLDGLVLSAPAFRVGDAVSPVKIWIGRKLEKFFPKLRIPDVLDLAAISRVPKVAEEYRRDPLNCRFNTLRQGNEILNALDRVPDSAKAISIPVLILHGTKDRIIRIEGSEELMTLIPSKDKTLRRFEGGFHEAHNDLCAEECFDAVASWIGQRA